MKRLLSGSTTRGPEDGSVHIGGGRAVTLAGTKPQEPRDQDDGESRRAQEQERTHRQSLNAPHDHMT
jgi:hypothetical protein